jgi:hypothetical protein
MPKNENQCSSSALAEEREKIDAALATARFLRRRISDLRSQCEELKRLQSTRIDEPLICSECGKPIEEDQEVTVKDSFGNGKGYFHKACFKAIWLSQVYRFDYSSPGFLRNCKKDR